jgi:hypothetical protein
MMYESIVVCPTLLLLLLLLLVLLLLLSEKRPIRDHQTPVETYQPLTDPSRDLPET